MCRFFMLATRNRVYAAAKCLASTAVGWTAMSLYSAGTRKGGRVVVSRVLELVDLRVTADTNPELILFYEVLTHVYMLWIRWRQRTIE